MVIAQLIGQTLGHYRVLRKVGGGGMGVVYEAEDVKLGRHVALKFLPDELAKDPQALERFRREARAASALNHPNICTIYEVDEIDERAFIAMELLEGQTLRQRFNGGPLEIKQVLDFGIQIADGLQAAHTRGIIHRDIKPENIFITSSGLAKILDFGLAKLSRVQTTVTNEFAETKDGARCLTMPQTAIGTILYMSPEQVRADELDVRSDLFSFGAVLYEMMTGKLAFSGASSGTVFDLILNRAPIAPSRLNSDVPADLERIASKCLEKDRNLRYQNAADVSRELKCLRQEMELGQVQGIATSEPQATKARFPDRRKRLKIAGSFLVAVVAIGTTIYFHRYQAKPLTSNDTIVLADFTNTTGDSVFDDTLNQALSISLRQSPFLNVISDHKIAETMQMMGRPAAEALTPALARDVCQRTASNAYVAGSIGSLGNQYVLGLRAVNCITGDTLAQEQVRATTKEKVLDTLGDIATKLRNKLGESLVTVQKFDVPLAEATTPSLDALKAYSLGQKLFREKDPMAVLPYYETAIQLDPNFAMAYWAMGRAYLNIGELVQVRQCYTKAWQLREHVSIRERLDITATYYFFVTGEIDKAVRTFQEEIQSYPQNASVYGQLANAYAFRGQYDKAIEATRQGLALQPDSDLYESLANFLLATQRLSEAKQAILHAQQKADDGILHSTLYALAFLNADTAGMIEQQRWFAAAPEYEDSGLSLSSDTEAYSGHLLRGRELSRRAITSAIRTGRPEGGAIWQANAALREGAFGNSTEAIEAAENALKLSPSSEAAQVEAALAFAMAGEVIRSESLVEHLEKDFPLDMHVQSLWLPTIRAQLALVKRNPVLALHHLEATASIESGLIAFMNNFSCFYPAYMRGEAYLATGQSDAAAAEFQKILDHSGIVWNCWTGALARLGVARANALQSRTSQGADAEVARVRALAAYKDFLTLWKDADLDIPILKQAKAEYAKLK